MKKEIGTNSKNHYFKKWIIYIILKNSKDKLLRKNIMQLRLEIQQNPSVQPTQRMQNLYDSLVKKPNLAWELSPRPFPRNCPDQ